MDLYFQGMAWANKGVTPDNVAQARSFFDRALAADPDNVDALIGSAAADVVEGVLLFVPDPMANFAAGEAKLTEGLCHAASGLRYSQQPGSQANEENQLPRVSIPA